MLINERFYYFSMQQKYTFNSPFFAYIQENSPALKRLISRDTNFRLQIVIFCNKIRWLWLLIFCNRSLRFKSSVFCNVRLFPFVDKEFTVPFLSSLTFRLVRHGDFAIVNIRYRAIFLSIILFVNKCYIDNIINYDVYYRCATILSSFVYLSNGLSFISDSCYLL